MLKIKATATTGRDLKPGDLFSTVGPAHWDNFELTGSIGERVYIRTSTPAKLADDMDALIYKIEIVKDDGIGLSPVN